MAHNASALPVAANVKFTEDNVATKYPAGLKIASFVTADAQFASDAYRFENGRLMAGPDCTFIPVCDNIKSQRLPTLAAIKYRQPIVDEEQGIVLLRMKMLFANMGTGWE